MMDVLPGWLPAGPPRKLMLLATLLEDWERPICPFDAEDTLRRCIALEGGTGSHAGSSTT